MVFTSRADEGRGRWFFPVEPWESVDIIEADDHLAAIGSGGPYALAAARALARRTDLSAAEICRESLQIAGEICIYTNQQHTIETLG